MENKFNINEWVFERSSGWAGYRNIVTDEWMFESEYSSKKLKQEIKDACDKSWDDLPPETMIDGRKLHDKIFMAGVNVHYKESIKL